MRILPRHLRHLISAEEIAPLHKSLRGHFHSRVNTAFLDVLRHWPLFGANMFEVTVSPKPCDVTSLHLVYKDHNAINYHQCLAKEHGKPATKIVVGCLTDFRSLARTSGPCKFICGNAAVPEVNQQILHIFPFFRIENLLHLLILGDRRRESIESRTDLHRQPRSRQPRFRDERRSPDQSADCGLPRNRSRKS